MSLYVRMRNIRGAFSDFLDAFSRTSDELRKVRAGWNEYCAPGPRRNTFPRHAIRTSCKNPRPKGRGARRREAKARKKGGTK